MESSKPLQNYDIWLSISADEITKLYYKQARAEEEKQKLYNSPHIIGYSNHVNQIKSL